MNNRLVHCDTCKGLFPLPEEGALLSRDRHYRGKECKETYFLCPHCKQAYLVNYETLELLKMQAEHQKLQAGIKKLAQLVAKGTTGKVLKQYNSLIKKKERLWFKLVSEHDKLKRHFKELDEREAKSLD